MVNNFIKSFPCWSQFSSRWVFCYLQKFSADEVPWIKSSDLHFLIIVPSHCSFVLRHSLLSFISNFVDQVQIAIKFLLILLFFISLHPNACQPYFHWDDGLKAKSQLEWCFSCWHPCRRPVCP